MSSEDSTIVIFAIFFQQTAYSFTIDITDLH